jgi:hypothetical protein
MSLQRFLLIADVQTFLFAVGAILAFFKAKVRQHYIILLGFCLIASVVGDFSAILLKTLKLTVNYGSTVYYILIIPLITAIYYQAIGRRHKQKFILVSFLYVLFGTVNVLFIQQKSINSYTLIIQSIIVIIYALYYFYWLIRELPTAQLHRLPMFWINSAYIIYFSGNLFLFVFTSYLVNVLNNDLLVYWTLHNVLGIIEGLMIIVALWMDLRNIKSHSS